LSPARLQHDFRGTSPIRVQVRSVAGASEPIEVKVLPQI
jgi:hypothetical protein